MKAVIVTGDRHANWKIWSSTVERAFEQHRDSQQWITVFQGGANGIDAIADAVCNSYFTYSEVAVPAQWKTHGKAAGPKRNANMLLMLLILKEQGYDIAVLAFHDTISESKGTKDMANRAIRSGVETWLYTTYNDPKQLTEVVS